MKNNKLAEIHRIFKRRAKQRDEEIQEYFENQAKKEGFGRRDQKSYEAPFCNLLKI